MFIRIKKHLMSVTLTMYDDNLVMNIIQAPQRQNPPTYEVGAREISGDCIDVTHRNVFLLNGVFSCKLVREKLHIDVFTLIMSFNICLYIICFLYHIYTYKKYYFSLSFHFLSIHIPTCGYYECLLLLPGYHRKYILLRFTETLHGDGVPCVVHVCRLG